MKKIAVISSSVREGRLSHRVALFLKAHLAERFGAQAEVLDLKEYSFPLFNERYPYLKEKPPGTDDFAARFSGADGIVVVSPVYNGSFPAALKNVVDLLVSQWERKPVLVVSVTYGATPGITTVQQLQTILMKMGARVASPLYTVLNAGKEFSESGVAADPAAAAKLAQKPLDEFMWLVAKSTG